MSNAACVFHPNKSKEEKVNEIKNFTNYRSWMISKDWIFSTHKPLCTDSSNVLTIYIPKSTHLLAALKIPQDLYLNTQYISVREYSSLVLIDGLFIESILGFTLKNYLVNNKWNCTFFFKLCFSNRKDFVSWCCCLL